ncbi:MAG: glycosyltransferase [Chloroflexota bacterium]
MRRVALLSLHSSPIAPLGRADVGGMNLYVRRLADEFQDFGIQADIFTRHADSKDPEVVVLESGARVIHLQAGPKRHLPKSVLPLQMPALAAAFGAFIERERREYDILHSHYWISGQVAMRYRVQQDSDRPFVHMFHTLAKVKEQYQGTPDKQESALRFDGERCLIGRADAIAGATEGEARDLARLYGRSPQRFAVIPPGVDVEQFSPRSKTSARARLGVHAEHVILFVGRLDRLKGLDTLLTAVSLFPPEVCSGLKVLFVGGREKRGAHGAPRLQHVVERLGLQHLVEFRGKVSQEELPWYYAAADVCAVPSAHETFGMVATEAMACQTPPVAFAVGGLTTTISDGQTGFLVPAADTAAFARTLEHALCRAPLELIGRRARLSVQRYSWRRTAERTIQLYEELEQNAERSRWPRVAGQ